MTPLAMHIAKQALLPEQSRFNDEANVLSSMGDIHCFEVSEIVDLASELAAQYPAYGAPDALMFLPAPKTWIEHKTSYGRVAFLLEESDDGFLRTEVWLGRNGKLGSYRFSRCVSKDQPRLVDETNDRMKRLNGFLLEGAAMDHSEEWFRAVLSIINTPRVIGRRQHQPHRGLERNQRRAGINYPLNAWSEIKLEVQRPKDMTGSGDHAATLTGGKALHFCRSFIRIKQGRLEIVRSHWRGDAANGVKLSRYKVAA